MAFAHDTEQSLLAAVALANSALEPETLGDPQTLREFFTDFDYTGRLRGDQAELTEVQALRPRLRSLLLADETEAVELCNALLVEGRALPQLVRHGDWGWHVHAIDPEAPLATRIMVETAMAMVDVIRADELNRLAICADDACEGVVLDLSRNRSRKFCSTQCNNRNAVAAYRRRSDVSRRRTGAAPR